LILESEVNRQRFESEYRQLRGALSWVAEANRLSQIARPWWPVLASVAGFLAVRSFRNSARLLSRAGSMLNLITTGYSIWKKTRPKPAEHAGGRFEPER
jgi:hypothetical protein